MSETPELHCRLCAEPTALNQAVSIHDETVLGTDLHSKLKWLSVDITVTNNLPKHICLPCFDVLDRMWSFLSQVRGAQEILSQIYDEKTIRKEFLSVKIEEQSEDLDSTSEGIEEKSGKTSELKDHAFYVKLEIQSDLNPDHVNSHCLNSEKVIVEIDEQEKCYPEEIVVEVDIPENIPSKRIRNRTQKASKTKLTCKICDHDFRYPSLLKKHIKAFHSTEEKDKDFVCHICGTRFYSKDTLSSHIEIHSDTNPYKCNYCPKAFRVPSRLKEHLLIHSNQKTYPCDMCSKAFNTQQYLNTHKLVHSDSKPFACNICDKSFKKNATLQAHSRQHTGEKPYRCEQCSKDFANWTCHYKHMKTQHNMKRKRETIIVTDLDIETIENQLKQ